MTDLDRAVAEYKERVAAESELAPRDVAEIEDHLRTLIEHLRASGLPLAHAIETAATRLGDPARIAREHARVRTAFGARLSRLRTWSVAALIAPMLWANLRWGVPHEGVVSVSMLATVFGLLAAIALVMRFGWARPVLLGGMAFCALSGAVPVVALPHAHVPMWMIADLGILAFVMPWRRGELSLPGITLALQIFTVATATWLLRATGDFFVIAQVTFVLALVACTGCVMRARWSAYAAGGAAFCLALYVVQIASAPLYMDTHVNVMLRAAIVAVIGSGAVAGAIGAVLSWRTARSSLGSLRGVLAT
jgi:hypothetical protein